MVFFSSLGRKTLRPYFRPTVSFYCETRQSIIPFFVVQKKRCENTPQGCECENPLSDCTQ